MKILRSTLFLLFLTTLALAKHECIHSKMGFKPTHEDILSPEFTAAYQAKMGRNLQTYSPIRIYADYSSLGSIPRATREYIQNHLMPVSIAYYEATLKVDPFPQQLRFTQPCGGAIPGDEVQSGVDADLVILVTAETSDESYIAYAGACSTSKLNNRPIYGLVNFNLRLLPFDATLDFQENFLTTTHEIAHILAFSDGLYQTFVQPGTSTLIANPVGTTTINGKTVAYLNLAPLNTRLRTHFNCAGTSGLTGIEGGFLENEGGEGSAGSHWERQFFFNEFMTASAITDSVISEFTLALFEGSGWYEVDYNNVDPFLWGKNRGCDFIKKKCLESGAVTGATEFCPTIQVEGCTFTGRSVGYCGARQKIIDSTLDPNYNYWGDKTAVVDSFANNCPYFRAYADVDCENPLFSTNGVLSQEVFAEGSRCMVGTLSESGTARSRQTGYCLPISCTGSPAVLTVTVGTRTVTCSAAGTQTVTGLAGTIVCPDPVDYCARANPARCYRGCSGKGSCINNACVCNDGWTGADCGARIYKDSCSQCTNSLDGEFCYGDKCGCSDPESCSAVIYGSVSILALIASIMVLFA